MRSPTSSGTLSARVFYLAMWAGGVQPAIAGLMWGYGTCYASSDANGSLASSSSVPPSTACTVVARPAASSSTSSSRRSHRFVAGLFLLAPFGKPPPERLARAFCPLPEALLARPFMRTFFMRISLLWAAVFLTNASVSFYLLLNQSVGTYVITKQALSSGLWIAAIATSVWYFVRLMRRHGIKPSFTGKIVG
jgi:hypothetical protein